MREFRLSSYCILSLAVLLGGSWPADAQQATVLGPLTTDSLSESREVVPGQKGLVFTTKKGTPVEPKTLDVAYKRLLSKAGLPDFRLHDLRHMAATQMMEKGVNPKVVIEMLGHSTISTMLDLYSHVTPTLTGGGRRPHGCGLGAETKADSEFVRLAAARDLVDRSVERPW